MTITDEWRDGFVEGANAMQARVSAFLMMKGQPGLAASVLGMSLPEPKPPIVETLKQEAVARDAED